MKVRYRLLMIIAQLAIIGFIIGCFLVLYATYDSRLKQETLRSRLAELQMITSASASRESTTTSNEVRQQCGSTTDLVSNLSMRAKAGGSAVNSVMASPDHEKRVIVISARGTYAVLKDETVMLVKEIPCASLDSVDFHRDRATDAELVSGSKMSLF